MAIKELVEPEGISFFNVKSGETHYAKLEPTIAAYINSSDIGINASRGQDFGWKLAPKWVKAVRDFRKDAMQMSILTQKNGGQKPTNVQVLYHLYEEQLRAYFEEVEENENPYEDEYQREITDGKTGKSAESASDLTDLIDDAIEEDDEEPAALTKEEQDAEDAKLLAEMEEEEAKAKAAGARPVTEVEAEEKAKKEAADKAAKTTTGNTTVKTTQK